MVRAAFSLVELLVAIALSAILVAAAVAGFRAAAQATTLCDRLSAENAMMRAGVAAAHDEVDFWRAVDDPDGGPARQALRGVSADGLGLPFTPFARAFPRVAAGDPAAPAEDDVGWDGDPAAWSPDRPATWPRVSLAEKARSDQRFGFAALFSAAGSGAVAVGDSDHAYGAVEPAHRWYANQLRGLERALGDLGLIEYAPADAVFAWYEPGAAATNAGGIALDHLVAGTGVCAKPNWEDDLDLPRGAFALTQFASFIVPDPRSLPAPDLATLIADARRPFADDFTTTLDPAARAQMTAMLARTAAPGEVMPLRPAAWPRLSVGVRRFVKRARGIAACSVRCASPQSGLAAELTFTVVGTTLRGARQQRGRDGGWAAWDDAARAPDGSRLDTGNGPCLDSY